MLTNHFLFLGERRKSLILWGPSRMGKTIWARSLGKHAYFGGLFSLDESLEGVQYAVFDDLQGGFEFFHSYKFWLGHQREAYVTDKYRAKTRIEWGRPAIYVTNDYPEGQKGVDWDWIQANCLIVHVHQPLF